MGWVELSILGRTALAQRTTLLRTSFVNRFPDQTGSAKRRVCFEVCVAQFGLSLSMSTIPPSDCSLAPRPCFTCAGPACMVSAWLGVHSDCDKQNRNDRAGVIRGAGPVEFCGDSAEPSDRFNSRHFGVVVTNARAFGRCDGRQGYRFARVQSGSRSCCPPVCAGWA